MALGYLISPVIQIENIDGKPLVGGHVAVYRHGTSIPYITYKDFNGDLNPASVPLNMLGSCILIADDANSYDIYVTNRFGGEVLSRLGVTVNGGGGGGGITTITCSDGSLNISQDGNVCDITIANEVTGRTVYVDWDGTSDKFSELSAIIEAGNVPVVRYNGYDYICVDSQNDGRYVFASELGESGVAAFIQFFRGGTPPHYKTVNLSLPYHTSSDAGKVLGLVQGSTDVVPGWVEASSGSVELFEATYNVTAYADIVQAIADHKIVYCRVPGTGSQARMAFLAYIGASNVEFQYYRSVSTKSASAQGDEVYVYTVSASGWTTTNRNTYVRIAAGTGLSQSYASGVLTLDATPELPSYTANEAGESLVVNANGDGVEWSRRISGILYNGSTGVEMRRLRVNSYNDTNTPGLVAAFPVTGQGVSCGTLMPDPDGVDKVARVIDNPNNPGIGMLAYQDDAAVISPLEKVTISTAVNPYQIDAQSGKWYEIVCSQSTAQTWHIYLEASTVTTDTVHTIVRITRTDSSISCSPSLVWHDERGVIHYEQCDLTGSTSYYDFDCLVRKNGYTVEGTQWSFARVRRL